MDFNELIKDFAARHSVENLVADEGSAALDIDGTVVSIVQTGDAVTITAEIGEPPADGRSEFAEVLLEANLQVNAFFAKVPERGSYVAVRRLELNFLTTDSFDEALENLVNQAETWRKLLDDFRPVAKTAAESDAEPPQFGTGGFMQV